MKYVLLFALAFIFTGVVFAQKFPNDTVTKQLIKVMNAKVLKASASNCSDGPLVQVASFDVAMVKADKFLRGIGYLKNPQLSSPGYISMSKLPSYIFYRLSEFTFCVAGF